MSKTVYDYMDWPEIEAVVYGEETAPRDVMGPRLTPDGVLIQGFFPEARAAAVVIGRKKYEMELEDEAGKPHAAPAETDQVSLEALSESAVVDQLRRAQVDTLSPLEALNLLYELKNKLV